MSDIQLNDPQTLYRRWEGSQWSPFDVDLSIDKEQWPALDPELREIIYFALSSLMVAEERITTKFTGLVAAYAPEEETTFLATQQVDEARHMQFYARFRDEVIAEPQTIGTHVQRAREQVSDSFRELFDGALVELHDQLVAIPGDLTAKVRFITLYHLVLESTLGLTTFQFVTDYLNAEGLLPGSVDGYSKYHHDERGTSATASGSCARPSASTPTRRRCPGDTTRAAARGSGVATAAGRWQRVGRAARRGQGRDPPVRSRRHDAPARDHRRTARDDPWLTLRASTLAPGRRWRRGGTVLARGHGRRSV